MSLPRFLSFIPPLRLTLSSWSLSRVLLALPCFDFFKPKVVFISSQSLILFSSFTVTGRTSKTPSLWIIVSHFLGLSVSLHLFHLFISLLVALKVFFMILNSLIFLPTLFTQMDILKILKLLAISSIFFSHLPNQILPPLSSLRCIIEVRALSSFFGNFISSSSSLIFTFQIYC